MADAEIRPLTQNATIAEIIDGVNRGLGILRGNIPGHFSLIGSDGVSRDIRGGSTLDTGLYTLKIRSDAGNHFHVRHSSDLADVMIVHDERIDLAADLINILGSPARIASDFSSGAATQTMFQSYIVNFLTDVGAIPNGTATTAQWSAFNNSAPASATGQAVLRATSTAIELRADSPAASYLPLDFYTSATKRVTITTAGRLDALASMALTGSLTANGGVGTASQVLIGGATPAWGSAFQSGHAAASGSTASTSYVSTTNGSVTLTTRGAALNAVAFMCANMAAASNAGYLALSLDGAAEVGEVVTVPANASQWTQGTTYRWAPAAGSHTVQMRMKVSGSTLTIFSGFLLVWESL